MKHLDLRGWAVCLLVIFISLSVLSGFLVQKEAAFAQLQELKDTAIKAGLGEETNPSAIIGKIIGIALTLMGIVLLVLILVGGMMWMTSGGNPEQVTKAKTIMKNAFIGLIIIVLAYAIAHFVVEQLSGVTTPTTPEPPPPPP